MTSNRGERGAAIEPVFDGVWRRGERPIVRVDCFDVAAEFGEHIGAMTVRLNQIRCERKRAIKTRQCLLLLPECRERTP